jgi:hypothetical protein
MKEITIAEFNKLKKKGPVSSQSLIPGKWYYIYDRRRVDNPVFIGKYLEPVKYFNENSVMYNYKFTDVSYLANTPKTRNKIRDVFGNVEKYFEVIDEPTKLDIKNKNKTINELNDFINEKKVEPYDRTPTISFFGKNYRKGRSKFYNGSHSNLSSISRRHSTPRKSLSSSLSRKRSIYSTASSSSSRRRSTPRTSSSSSRRCSRY